MSSTGVGAKPILQRYAEDQLSLRQIKLTGSIDIN